MPVSSCGVSLGSRCVVHGTQKLRDKYLNGTQRNPSADVATVASFMTCLEHAPKAEYGP